MTRLFPLLLFAALLCALIVYARLERQAEAEWAATCAKIESEAKR